MKHDKAIARYSSDVVLKIGLFILVYICLIALGAGLIWLAFQLAVLGFLHIPQMRSIRLMVVTGILIFGVICFALMFGLYLFKFLFTRQKNESEDGREVKEAECPQLFEAIRQVAAATGCPMPKKVYLSTDVNACVFYNTSFWSIFFPVRKNLEIGLGLFTGLNVDELKSILAHEFGHFAQKSMKVGSGTYVANTVLHNLAFQEDRWDRWVDEWSTADLGMFSYFGVLTRKFTNLIKRLLRGMYGMVNRAYMKLSRQMEFDADAVACHYIGKDVFISGLCKINCTDISMRYSMTVLQSLANEGKKPTNVFELHAVLTEILLAEHNQQLHADKLLTDVVDYYKPHSEIVLQSAWDTHPSLENRMANVQEITVSKEVDFRPAWVLVPSELVLSMSHKLLTNATSLDADQLTIVSEQELIEYSKAYRQKNSIAYPYKHFINRRLFFFSREGVMADGRTTQNPFTPENTELMKQQEVAQNDADTLCDIRDGFIETEYIFYRGVQYTKKDIPLDAHLEYLKSLNDTARVIDVDVYNYILSRATTEEMKQETNSLYDTLFAVQHLFDTYQDDIRTQVNAIVSTLNAAVRRTEEEMIEIKKYVFQTEDNIKDMLKNTAWQLMEKHASTDEIAPLVAYAKSPTYKPLEADLDFKSVNLMLQTQADYFEMLRTVYYASKITLGHIIQKVHEA